jgi:hypothetical protein
MPLTPARWLAIYEDYDGDTRTAMIGASDPTLLPFGVDGSAIGLPEYNPGAALTLIEMPADPEFRPTIVDCDIEAELPLQFIDL